MLGRSWSSWTFLSRESRSCVPAVATRTQTRTALSPHFIVSVAQGTEVSKVRSITELCGMRVSEESYVTPKGPLQCKRCQRFGHTQRKCGYAPRCFVYGVSQISGGCFTLRYQPQFSGCGSNNTVNYRGCIKWKETKAALVKRAPEGIRKSADTDTHCRSENSVGRAFC